MDAETRVPGPGGAWTAGVIVVAITVLSTFTLADPEQTTEDASGNPTGFVDAGEEAAEEQSGEGPSTRRVEVDAGQEGTAGREGGAIEGAVGPGGAQTGGPGQAQGNYDCDENQNAGTTDIGVSNNEIRLAATVVRTGIAKDFLGEAELGIEAVVRKTNRAGGICGRLLKVTYSDDGWNFADGSQAISKWIGEKNHFGLIVNPSSEGLRGAIEGDLIGQNEFPVVGADGMLIGQYHEPWVWPVATSTHSVMQIMANEAYRSGARSFGIVYENNYRFGVEGEYAFRQTIERRCPDCKIVRQAIKGGELSYRNEANAFLGDCGSDFAKCDFVALLLEPSTASQWRKDNGMGSGDDKPAKGVGAPQPLFVDSFIRDCGQPCAGMWVWTSFKPPIHPFDRDPKVAEYVSDMQGVSRSVDVSNPHVQGAYVGASLLVEALKELGPIPTRQGLREVLDGMTFDSGLAPPLKFSEGNHFAAVSAQAFEAIFNKDKFVNWQHTKDFVADKEVHVDQLRD